MGQKTRRPSEWFARAALLIAGVMVFLFGLFEWQHGYFWHVYFNERFGRPGFTPALWLLALGLLSALVGLMPWKRISDWVEQRDARRRR